MARKHLSDAALMMIPPAVSIETYLAAKAELVRLETKAHRASSRKVDDDVWRQRLRVIDLSTLAVRCHELHKLPIPAILGGTGQALPANHRHVTEPSTDDGAALRPEPAQPPRVPCQRHPEQLLRMNEPCRLCELLALDPEWRRANLPSTEPLQYGGGVPW
jgi:hypothetical protein